MKSLRNGWTLFELMVVMALLVIVGALAAPALQGSYANFKVKSAGDSIRGAWAKARSLAMNQGCAYRFSIIPNTGKYRIAPDNSSATGPNGSQPSIEEGDLPKGVQIAVSSTTPSAAPDPTGVASDPSLGATDGQYVVAAVFLPDGTAREDVDVTLSAQGASSLCVHLRGLTGGATSEPAHAEAGHL